MIKKDIKPKESTKIYRNSLAIEEEKQCIRMIRNGTEEEYEAAWGKIYAEFIDLIASVVRKKMNLLITNPYDQELEKDLTQAGYLGVVSAVRKYKLTSKAKLTTYAMYYIERNISYEFMLQMSSGTKNNSRRRAKRSTVKQSSKIKPVRTPRKSVSTEKNNTSEQGKYGSERLTLQLLDVIRKETDINNKKSSLELRKALSAYIKDSHGNTVPQADEDGKTIHKILAEMAFELDDEVCIDDEDFFSKIKMNESDSMSVRVKSAPSCKSVFYKHLFDDSEMDKLIQLVCSSEQLTDKEKKSLVNKLISTKSNYYSTPLWDRKKNIPMFDPKGIHGRYKDNKRLTGNIKTIQEAINSRAQISFKFNRYTEDKELVYTTGKEHIVNPYHIVIYHDNYYLICTNRRSPVIQHYRLDLMTDVSVRKDKKSGQYIPVEYDSLSDVPRSVRYLNWNPSQYMSEHLYMGYDKPRKITFRAKKSEEKIFTTFHDWFDDNFTSRDDRQNPGSIILEVTTSPSLIVPFALQYSDMFEVVNPEIREEINKKISELRRKYKE